MRITYPHHKINDINKWIETHLKPQLDTFLMYEKVVEYHKIFGNNLIILHNDELKNNPQDLLTSLFYRLELEPIKIKEKEENASIMGFINNKYKKYIVSFMLNTDSKCIRIARLFGLENRYLFKTSKIYHKKNLSY